MDAMINGKTAEEIKRNLSWLVRCNNCPQNHEYGCDYENRTKECQTTDDALALIERLEAAVPVVHARWVTQGIEVYCTNCMMPQDSRTNYCPCCGAKMDALSNVPDKNVGKLGGVINAK